MNKGISEKMPASSKFIEIDGAKIHYLDDGMGDPILFLHGVPTSCYLWRNIIPHLSSLGRCIAPDLIGFGKSDKPNIPYSIQDHIHYIEKFIEALNLENITLVMHGWGSVIGFNYAMQHEKNCKGLIFYEAFLQPLNQEEDISLPLQEQLRALQDLEKDPEAMKNGRAFVDIMISQNVMRSLTETELENYHQAFIQTNSGKPIFQYIKELQKGDDKAAVDKLIVAYSKKLTHSQLPKLMMYSLPGFIATMAAVMWAKKNLPNIEIADIGEELHLAQESNPDIMGETMSAWLQGIDQSMGEWGKAK
jgi:haloalkane dehalogenase